MLAWMDLEMTGLDPGRDVIVEIATLVTDDDSPVVAEGPDLVVSATAEQLDAMADVVRDMHTRSGLLAAIEASTLSPRGCRPPGARLPAPAHPRARDGPALPGTRSASTAGSWRLPARASRTCLHYRSVDVSTVKELCRRWYPEALAGAPGSRPRTGPWTTSKRAWPSSPTTAAAIFRPPARPTRPAEAPGPERASVRPPTGRRTE